MLFCLYLKGTLPNINHVIEYINWIGIYIKLKKDKVVINVKTDSTFSVRTSYFSWHKTIQMKTKFKTDTLLSCH
jgi:hypothetical protein